MRVLFVSRPIVPPWNEGSKNLAWQIATRLQRHTPYLLTTRNASLSNVTERVAWQRPYTSDHLSTIQKLHLFNFLMTSSPDWDLYHFLFVPTLMTSYLLRWVLRRYRLPSVQTVPSLPAVELSSDNVRKLFFADRVVTYTETTAAFLKSVGVSNVMHINVGVAFDDGRFPRSDQEAAVKATGMPANKKLILYAGEYSRLGAIAQLEHLMPIVLTQCTDCHFIIACRLLRSTDVRKKAAFQQWVKQQPWQDRVHFLGEVPDFAMLLRACHLFLFPVTEMSGKIDTPLTMLEAMSIGLPVLTYDVSPLPEIFGQDSQYVLPTGSFERMAEKILHFVHDEDARQRAVQTMQDIIQQRYRMDKMVMAYESLYDSI